MARWEVGNDRAAQALRSMPNDSSDGQACLPSETFPSKWRTKLQRQLFRIWLVASALWAVCVMAISGQCIYGHWFGWHQQECDVPLVYPVETYTAYFATAVGPPAVVLLTYRIVVWVSNRVRSRRR